MLLQIKHVKRKLIPTFKHSSKINTSSITTRRASTSASIRDRPQEPKHGYRFHRASPAHTEWPPLTICGHFNLGPQHFRATTVRRSANLTPPPPAGPTNPDKHCRPPSGGWAGRGHKSRRNRRDRGGGAELGKLTARRTKPHKSNRSSSLELVGGGLSWSRG